MMRAHFFFLSLMLIAADVEAFQRDNAFLRKWQREPLRFSLNQKIERDAASSSEHFEFLVETVKHLLVDEEFVHTDSKDRVKGSQMLDFVQWHNALPSGKVLPGGLSDQAWVKVSPNRDFIHFHSTRLVKRRDGRGYELQTMDSQFIVNLMRVLSLRLQVSQGQVNETEKRVPRVNQRTQIFQHVPFSPEHMDMIFFKDGLAYDRFNYLSPIQVCNLLGVPGDVVLFDNETDRNMEAQAETPRENAEEAEGEATPNDEDEEEDEKLNFFAVDGYSKVGYGAIAIKELLSANFMSLGFQYTHTGVVSSFSGMHGFNTIEKYPGDDELRHETYRDHKSFAFIRAKGDFLSRQEGCLQKATLALTKKGTYTGNYCSDFANWACDNVHSNWFTLFPVIGDVFEEIPIWGIDTPDNLAQSGAFDWVCKVDVRKNPKTQKKEAVVVYPKQINIRELLAQYETARKSKEVAIQVHAENMINQLRLMQFLDVRGQPIADVMDFRKIDLSVNLMDDLPGIYRGEDSGHYEIEEPFVSLSRALHPEEDELRKGNTNEKQ